ncbi:tetratricopeptide repeat protein [Criblamydia sequanensis]|uniref:Conserved putative secreted protein n=1 Tax=Candidatus Criblamydia sequanensis CRIB-18 TaxID=1437425 RepID=A0A090D2C8_9BACT|nr:hypothetical protein [Criblamydia sequanensis]CDR34545.1 Conserved putative secreted protein [Criblamydia sequanensis CRIB-18]
MRKLGLLSLMICGAFLSFSLAHLLPKQIETRKPEIQKEVRKETGLSSEMLSKKATGIRESSLSEAAALVSPLKEIAYVDERFIKNEAISQDELLNEATASFQEGNYSQVFKIAKKVMPAIENKSGLSEKWLHLLIETAFKQKDAVQLAIFYDFQNKAFKDHEDAALLVAKNYIQQGNREGFFQISNLFPEDAKSDEWRLLESDLYLFENNRQEAIDVLKAKHLNGKMEVERLLRLALFNIRINPKQAWMHLKEAHSLDPTNTEVLSYQGKLMELAKEPEKALSLYFMAWNLDPDNLKLSDQLADFYLRRKDYARSLDIWSQNLNEETDDPIWIKALFFSKVVKPINLPAKPENDYSGYSDYLYSLKPWEFWNEQKLQRFNLKSEEKVEQSAFWLKLLNEIEEKNEITAYNRLKTNPFKKQSWVPELEIALKQVLYLRNKDSLEPLTYSQDEEKLIADLNNSKSHPIFQEINQIARNQIFVSEATKKFISGNLILPSLFLAAGWKEAALELQHGSLKTEETPIWVALALMKAIKENHGLSKALAFSKQLPDTAEIRLLKAELLLEEGQAEEALSALDGLNNKVGEEGKRAALLEVLAYLILGDDQAAEHTIHDNSLLDKSIEGQEILAELEFRKGNEMKAEEIYLNIADGSMEAKSYLAKKAYQRGNLQKSRELTLELLDKDPANRVLLENLQRIEWHLNPEQDGFFP